MEGAAGNIADLSRPHMAMADQYGNIFIADKEAHAIRRVATDGTIATVAGIPGNTVAGNGGDALAVATTVALNNPNGLYTFPDGRTFILDLGNGKIRRLGKDGMIETVLSDPDFIRESEAAGTIGGGRGLWVSDDETLIYYGAGIVIRRWRASQGSDTVASGFVNLGNFDLDADGNILASDRFGHRVYRVSPSDGASTAIAGTGATSGGSDGTALGTALNEVRGIFYLRETGGYFVCTHRDSQVWYADSSGGIHLLINGDRNDGTHAGDGLLLTVNPSLERISEPRAVTMAPNGDLLITENDRGFIRRVRNAVAGAAEASILDVVRQIEGGIRLSWESAPGAAYEIEASPTMEAGSWESVWKGMGHFLFPQSSAEVAAPGGLGFLRIKETRY
jgi:hypothetical protein